MKLDEDTLIQQLKATACKGGAPSSAGVRRKEKPAPPVTEAEILEAEARLGFPLPPLFRRLYLEVSNGDFGPGLMMLVNGPLTPESWGADYSIVSWYVGLRSTTQEELDARYGTEEEDRPMVLPEKILFIADWGCSIYSCVDCSKPECPVLRNDNNESFRTFAIEAPSLHEWLEEWLNRKQVFWLDWEKAEKVTF